MLSWMTAAIVAIVAVAFAPSLPTASVLAVGVSGGLLASMALPQHWRWPLVAFLLSGAYASGYGHWRVAQLLPSSLEGKDLALNFRVMSSPEQRGEFPVYYRFDAEPLREQCVSTLSAADTCNLLPPTSPALQKLGRLRLNWYGERPPALGAVVHGDVRLRRPHGYQSPGAFNYGRWLFVSGYSAVGYVRNPAAAINVGEYGTFSAQILRQRLIAFPLVELDKYSHGAVMKALLFADRSAIRPQQWALFSQTGTSHLMAISGMHIGMVLLWGWGLGRVTGFFVRRGLSHSPLLAFSCALVYAAMAGFSVPTQRALVMAVLVLLGYGLRRTISRWQVYFAAMLLVLVLDPLAPHQLGFNLSFAAVGVLLWAFQGQRHKPALSLLHSQWVVVMGLLPVLGLWGLGFSLASVPANLLAIPMLGMLILPSLFAGLLLLPVWPNLAHLLFSVADFLLEYLQRGLAVTAEWAPYIDFQPPIIAVVLGLIGGLILLLPRGLPAKWLALTPLLAMFYWPKPVPAKDGFWVTVLDVGQGLAVMVRTQSKSLLFDVGADFSSGFNTADAVVLPALTKFGVDHLDVLVLSHADRDHAGAAPALLAALAVDKVFRGEQITSLARVSKPCRSGEVWTWDGVDFEFLAGAAADAKGNNASCVLRVSAGRASVLLTGDIEADIERRLLGSQYEKLRANLLIAPHHGSKTSSTLNFIEAVAPRDVVFSAGRHNSYGHPAHTVVHRYRQQGSRCWYTGHHGTVQFQFANGQLTDFAYARARSYYWEHALNPEICPKFNSEG